MEPSGRRAAGAARGPAEMGGPGGAARDGAAAPGLPAGPARFRCPEDFCARRLAPGAAFCPESLGAPGKRLLLIRAPADFRPESLSGHRLALLGSPLLRASQPDGSQKVYALRATREESAARLLIAAGRPERLTCAQPFGGSLRIQERDGAPDAPRPLFPVAERPPPQVPGGLKQRFFPFGARLPSSGAPPRKAARERGKKRPLGPWKQALWQPEGPEQLLGGSPAPAEALLKRAGSKQRPLKEEAEEPAAAAATGPATLPGLWQDAGPSGRLEEASWSGEAEERSRRRARKKEKKRRKTGLETEELPGPTSRYWQPEREPQSQGGREPEGGGCRAKETRMPEAGTEELWGTAAAIKEEPEDVPCLGSLPEEDPAGEVPGSKKKKKKKKKERRRSRERAAEGLWGVFAIKEEPGDVPCLESLPKEALGSPREEPGRELAGYIKQSPGKGAGGPWSCGALKEEPGDVSSLGSLAEESRGATPEDPAEEPPSCKKKKKKKKKRSQERALEGLWGMAAIKEEPGDVPCLGGPAGELLACKKEEREKLDKEPLWEQGTETQQCLESNMLDGAAPLWQGAEGPEEPWPTNGAAPSPRPKRKKGRRRRDQAGLFAAGT